MPPPDELSDKFRQWAILKQQNTLVQARMNSLRDDLMAAVAANGDQDERGNTYLPLATTVNVGDQEYSAIKREARTATLLNEERALALAEHLGIHEAIVQRPHIDVDALYAAWQREQISEEQLQGLFDTTVTHAFKPVAS